MFHWHDPVKESFRDFLLRTLKGGPGSGHHGHRGIPHHRGGSMPGDSTIPSYEETPHTPRPNQFARETDPAQMALPFPEQLPLPLQEQPEEEPPVEEWIKDGEITDVEDLGGGISETYVAYIGDQRVVVKPDSGIRDELLREGVEPMRDNHREIAAVVVNDALGNIVKIPATTIRETPMGFGLVQRYLEDSEPLAQSGREMSADEERPFGLFDAVIGNVDRHGKNVMVDSEGTVWAIDHGLSFPVDNRSDRSDSNMMFNRESYALKDHEVSALKTMRTNSPAVTKRLKSYLNDDEIRAMWERVDNMITTNVLRPPGDDFFTSGQSAESQYSGLPESDINF